ncbi:Dioxygenase [Novipirellula aureliae]|uniref:Dioxygenase n=1 Tax=Novipirellula aureliae TaxID=2527966 RepID=A0A5C6DQ74_9BACT|nr:carboxypeptidase-like regulatory domain-containing protein [Novipirellula aureliae]TWU37801.1 Dioxygenase [Novipirellula aureliae]
MNQRGLCLLAIACTVSVGCSSELASNETTKVVDFSDVKAASAFDSAATWKLDADVKSNSIDPLEIHGKVIDEMQQPVADARVGCWVQNWDNQWKLISKTTSDENGEYTLDAAFVRDLDERFAAMGKRHITSDSYLSSINFMLDGRIERYGFPVYVFAATPIDRVAWVTPQLLLSRSRIDCDLELQPIGGSVYGVLYDESGEVVVGEDVALGSIFQQRSGESLVPYLSPLGLSGWKTKTDKRGRFLFNNLPPNTEVFVNHEQCWTNTPLRAGPHAQAIRSSPFALTKRPEMAVVLSGTVLHSSGEPADGAIIKSATKQITVDERGRYQVEVSRYVSSLKVIPPPDSTDLGWKWRIDRKAVAKGMPQPDYQLVAGRWISGTIRSAPQQEPIKDVIVETNGRRLLARTDEAGTFRVLVEHGCKTLRLMPGWLSDRELEQYVSQGKSLEIELSVSDRDVESLGEIRFVESDSQPPLPVQVTFPDGSPVPDAKVRCWVTPNRKPGRNKSKPILQTQSIEGQYRTFALTDNSGKAEVRTCFDFECDRLVTVIYPEVDPQFFAELKVKSTQQPIVKIRLQRAVKIDGVLTFNEQPLSHGLIRAVATAEHSNEENFQVLNFLGVSDSDGHYEVIAADANQYGLTIQPGLLTKGWTLIGNEPAMVSKEEGVERVTGPELSILRGNRTAVCRVVNHLGRDVTQANVSLLPDPGQVVLSMIAGQRDGNRTKLFDVPNRPIRVTATLDPIFRPGGSFTKMLATTPMIQASDIETEIVIAPAKFFPLNTTAKD